MVYIHNHNCVRKTITFHMQYVFCQQNSTNLDIVTFNIYFTEHAIIICSSTFTKALNILKIYIYIMVELLFAMIMTINKNE